MRGARLVKGLFRRATAKMANFADLRVFDPRANYARDGLFTVHNDSFRHESRFSEAYHRGIQASQGVDPQFEWRVHIALWVASRAVKVAGDFVECGVNAGFMSSAIMQHLDWAALGRRFFLIDTFAGPVLSQYSDDEIGRGRAKVAAAALEAGAYVTDLDRIRANYADWPGVELVQGIVPEVLSEVPVERIAFLHLDLNCAYPERAALEHFWDRITPGGFVLLDDYCYTGYDAQTQAINEVGAKLGFDVLSLPTGQGLIQK